MSGEKGANLAPKEACMGARAKSRRAEKAAWGSLSEEGYHFLSLPRQMRLRSSDDPLVNGF